MIQLGTKAETLNRIYNKLSYAHVLPQISFTVSEWRSRGQEYYQRCIEAWGEKEMIVRSSAINEDTQESSQAGKYESVGHVQGRQNFVDAVQAVIASFDDDNELNQILVQPMLQNVKMCGVAFTLDPNSLGNYYVINYDTSGSTSVVTSGNGQGNRLLYVFKGEKIKETGDEIDGLCMALRELEELFGQNNLDVEFAVDDDGELYIFQVRTLCINGQEADMQQQQCALKRIDEKLRQSVGPKPYLCGDKTIYSVMTDWNPAEMIGVRPQKLALSLYREMITDRVWAYQRNNYGYRDLRSFPLMVDFGGLPYIDVRVSFNSFVPAELDEGISNKLVNYYLERLITEPAKHDKVEFDIVFSCYTLDIPERIRILKKYGFTEDEIQQITNALRNVTNRIIRSDTGLWRKDYEKIRILEKRYRKIIGSDIGEVEKIYWLLEDCKSYGTLPFAGLARGAFIAVQFLKSMVKKDIISQEDYQDFMNDVNTVSSNMNRDFLSMSRDIFMAKYGHLRPGTYDITSLRYDEAPDIYFDWTGTGSKKRTVGSSKRHFSLSLPQMHHLKDMLEESGLGSDILGLMDFIKTVIEGREYGKFIFTQNLSKVIQMIGDMGAEYGLEKTDCAYLDIRDIKSLYSSAEDVGKLLTKSIAEGKAAYELTKTLVLPPMLVNADEIWAFYYPDTEPNFITLKKASGETAVLDDSVNITDIGDKIVLISCADPGYDWIFSHHIRGFITMYGGANSHMAIRAGELGIPAVVGVGEKKYEMYRNARNLEIDAMAKTVRIL